MLKSEVQKMEAAARVLDHREIAEISKAILNSVRDADMDEKSRVFCAMSGIFATLMEKRCGDAQVLPAEVDDVHACLLTVVRVLSTLLKTQNEKSQDLLQRARQLVCDKTGRVPADLLINGAIMFLKLTCSSGDHGVGKLLSTEFTAEMLPLNQASFLVAFLGHECSTCVQPTVEWLDILHTRVRKGLRESEKSHDIQEIIGWHRCIFHGLKKLSTMKEPLPKSTILTCNEWINELFASSEVTVDTVRHIARDCFPMLLATYAKLDPSRLKCVVEQLRDMEPHRKSRCDGKAEDLLKNLVIVDSKVAASMCDALDFEKVTEPQLRLVLKCQLALKMNNKGIEGLEKFVDLGLMRRSEEICLAAFAAECFCLQTTKPIPERTFASFLIYYDSGKFTRVASVRQRALAVVKKFLKWIADSCAPSKRNEGRKDHDEHVMKALTFFGDLFGRICRDFVPGAHYASLSFALGVLGLISGEMGWDCEPLGSWSEKGNWWKRLMPGLLSCVREPFDDLKEAALNILRSFDGFRIEPFAESQFLDHLIVQSSGFDAKTASSAACMIGLLSVAKEGTGILSKLKSDLSKAVELAEEDFVAASASSPMFGTLCAIRRCFKSSESLGRQNLNIIEEIMALTRRCCVVALPVSASESPEGFLPEMAASNEVEEPTEESNVQCVTSRMILSCSWRTLKEGANLIQVAVETFMHDFDPGFLIDLTSVLVEILEVVKHRAAFEQVFSCFKSVCFSFWRCSNPSLAKQPSAWLESLLGKLSDTSGVELCTTRRGAGVPFICQAILATEPTVNAFNHLHKAMQTLFKCSDIEVNSVTCVNLLRALFCDSDCCEGTSVFVEQGLLLCIRNFNSRDWGLRNATSLMFVKLLVRVFGVRRDKNDECASKNSKTLSRFRSEFPSLWKVMESEVLEAVPAVKVDMDDIDKRRQVVKVRTKRSLVPVLILLRHLKPTEEREEVRHGVVRGLLRCLRSEDLETRSLAGDAILSLTRCEEIPRVLGDIFCKLPDAVWNEGACGVDGLLITARKLLVSPGFNADKLPPIHLLRGRALDVITIFMAKRMIDEGGKFLVFELLGSCDISAALKLPSWEPGVLTYKISTLSLLLSAALGMKLPWKSFVASLTSMAQACENDVDVITVVVEFLSVLVGVKPLVTREVDCVLLEKNLVNVKEAESKEVLEHCEKLLVFLWNVGVELDDNVLMAGMNWLLAEVVRLRGLDDDGFVEQIVAHAVKCSRDTCVHDLKKASLSLAFACITSPKCSERNQLDDVVGDLVTIGSKPQSDVELKLVTAEFLLTVSRLRPDLFKHCGPFWDALYLLLNSAEDKVRCLICCAVDALDSGVETNGLCASEEASLRKMLNVGKSRVSNDVFNARMLSWVFSLGDACEGEESDLMLDDAFMSFRVLGKVLLENLDPGDGICLPSWVSRKESETVEESLLRFLRSTVELVSFQTGVRSFAEEELLLRRIFIVAGVLRCSDSRVDEDVRETFLSTTLLFGRTELHSDIGDLLFGMKKI
ncbi:unnamed protein product [Notodromas monacha]|uniref:DUF2428 domain-containing protein n=1 Tax=Notodromas monacha TaxID=399045 RepID=A0A7R9BQX4_9CRUS|nr:unnamed protein product [Notodromas monacha]CAG0919714.1 unnamed protein product [Notodromas monacha]